MKFSKNVGFYKIWKEYAKKLNCLKLRSWLFCLQLGHISYLPVVAPILKWRYSSTVAYKDLEVYNGIFVWPMINIINLHWEKWMVNNIYSRHMVCNINTIFMPQIEWSGAYCYCPVCLLATLTFTITFEPYHHIYNGWIYGRIFIFL